jgi:lysophospholipase L1-like esterase
MPGGPHSTPIELLVFGDSTAAGVGVDRAADSMPVQLARLVAADRSRPVRVLSYGWAGAVAADVVRDQLPRASGPLRPHIPHSPAPLPGASVAVVSIGANDVIHATAPWRFRRAMRQILEGIATGAPSAEVAVVGIPRFRGVLRQYEPLIPLRDLIGALLRWIQRRETESAGVAYADLAREVIGRLDPRTASLAADAFHPGPQIYGAWAEVIAEALERRRGAVSRRAGPTGA